MVSGIKIYKITDFIRKTETGKIDLRRSKQIIEELSKIEQIKEVRGTYGIYDIFCRIEADSKNVLDDVITFKIRKVPKIRSTITLHWIPSQGGR